MGGFSEVADAHAYPWKVWVPAPHPTRPTIKLHSGNDTVDAVCRHRVSNNFTHNSYLKAVQALEFAWLYAESGSWVDSNRPAQPQKSLVIRGIRKLGRLKPAYAATETMERLEMWDIETRGIILSKQWIIKALIRLFCSSVPVVLFDTPGISRCLSSPHLCFIIVFICDLFVSRDDPLMS